MSTYPIDTEALAESVHVAEDTITVDLVDGRSLSVPIIWFPRLAEGTPEQLANCEILADGERIHWPDLDEDLSVAGLLRGSEDAGLSNQTQSAIQKVLALDESHIRDTRRLLAGYGLLELLERVQKLWEALSNEVQNLPGCDDVRAMQVYMQQACAHECMLAFGHLLRAHNLAIFPHARTMMELAGISYLASRKGESVVTAFWDHEPESKEWQQMTRSSEILPATDPNTQELNSHFKYASSRFHANVGPLLTRNETSFVDLDDGHVEFTSKTHLYYELPTDEGATHFLVDAQWLLMVTYRVLCLMGTSFRLPDCMWHRRMEHFGDDLRPPAQRIHALVHKG